MKKITSSILLTAVVVFLGACDKQSANETKLLSPKYHGAGHGDDAGHGEAKPHGDAKAHGEAKPAAEHGAAPAKPAH